MFKLIKMEKQRSDLPSCLERPKNWMKRKKLFCMTVDIRE